MRAIQVSKVNPLVNPTQTAVSSPPPNSAESRNPAVPAKTDDTQDATKWTVGRGSNTIPIYRTPHGDEVFYTVSYWLDKKRHWRVFPTLKKANAFATTKAEQMDFGDHGAAKLTNEARAAYKRASDLLRPSGASLEFAASEYASASKRLGAVSLSQAVDFYLKRYPVHMVPKMVPEVVSEMIQLKRSDQLSDRYIQQRNIPWSASPAVFKTGWPMCPGRMWMPGCGS